MSTSQIQNGTQKEERRVNENSKPDELSQEAVNKLRKHLEEMPENMRLFSLCFRALYTDEAADGHNDAAAKFRKIRDDTRQDAMVYLKCILPVTTSFIRSVKKYFENYEALSYEEWLNTLPDILEDTKEHKDFTQSLLDMYRKIMVPFKKREDDAKRLMREFEDLQSKYKKLCAEYEATANKKKKWANALLFVPVVNLIAYPLLGKSARKNNAKALASKTDAEFHQNAARAVAETLNPALSSFIDGLKNLAGFFQVLEQELKSFEKQAERDERKMLHYKVMCYSAKDIKSLCHAFYQVLPDVETDFEALPIEDTDQNYVEKWLEETRAEIKSQPALVALFGAFSGPVELNDRKLKQPTSKPDPKPAQPRHVTQGIKLPGMETPPKAPPN